MTERLPWSKFDWDAWDTDAGLALCSMGAQGFWMRLLCMCSKEHGYLLIKGDTPTPDQLAFLTRQPLSAVSEWLAELEKNRVFSRDRKGVIFSRRMVLERKKSAASRENGKSGGNPTLRKHSAIRTWDNPHDNPPYTPPLKLEEEREEEREREEKKSARTNALGRSQIEETKTAFNEWNQLASRLGLPQARKLDSARQSAIRARLADGGIDTWRKALQAVEASKFCRGQSGNPFKADLDFVCQPKSWNRLLEGFYGRDAASVASGAESRPINMDLIWRDRMKTWRASGNWREVAGPPPGQPGCEVPPVILAEYGYGPKSETNLLPFEPRKSA